MKDKSKKLKCRLLQFLFGALRVEVENCTLRKFIFQLYLESQFLRNHTGNINGTVIKGKQNRFIFCKLLVINEIYFLP